MSDDLRVESAPTNAPRVLLVDIGPDAGVGRLAMQVASALAEAELQAERVKGRPTAEQLAAADLLIGVSEPIRWDALMELEGVAVGAGVPFLSLRVTAGAEGEAVVDLGPLFLPPAGCCLGCTRAELEAAPRSKNPDGPSGGTGVLLELDQSSGVGRSAARTAARVTRELLHRPQQPRLLHKVLRFQPDGRRPVGIVQARAECSRCQKPDLLENPSAKARGLRAAAELELLPAAFDPGLARRDLEPGSVATVGVLGGGTAGYLAALAIRRKQPRVRVVLIESSSIPVIGVGEATTPLLPAFLHGTLGLDIVDFHRRVQPSWKLGIRFDWGRPGGFVYPFERGRLQESWAYEGHGDAYGLAALAMANERSPLLCLGPGQHRFLPAPFAYHLDNKRLVLYLQEQAQAAGVERVDRRIEGAEVHTDEHGQPRISALRDSEGGRLSFDFYLDCSGFRSVLLSATLGVPWRSFDSSLFTDRAVVAASPHPAPAVAHTQATTMDAGWCWRIPLPEEEHLGYVYSSEHASSDRVLDELGAFCRRLGGELGEAREVRFRSGRHAEAWRGNVVALGNAHAFVEPLESTSLHMLVVSLLELLRHWPQQAEWSASRTLYNEELGRQWDDLRTFLALHFRFNERKETPFWQACRRQVDVQASQPLLDFYREGAPISQRPHRLRLDSLWGDFGRDVLLLGQGVPTRLLGPRMAADRWAKLLTRGRSLVARALSQEQALAVVGERPELLTQLARQAPWMQDAAVGGRRGW